MRLADEFAGGQKLLDENLEEDDIANLLIQQIEFCNTILLNKVDCLNKQDLEHVKAVVKALQPTAKMIETNYGKVDMKEILDTKQFDFGKVAESSAWAIRLNGMDHDNHDEDDDDHDEHHHDHEEHEHHHDHDDDDHSHCDHEHGICHCGHHHDKDHPHGDEYGISTFVYEHAGGVERTATVAQVAFRVDINLKSESRAVGLVERNRCRSTVPSCGHGCVLVVQFVRIVYGEYLCHILFLVFDWVNVHYHRAERDCVVQRRKCESESTTYNVCAFLPLVIVLLSDHILT